MKKKTKETPFNISGPCPECNGRGFVPVAWASFACKLCKGGGEIHIKKVDKGLDKK